LSFAIPPWENSLQPSQGNVGQFLDNLYSRAQPIEQARWNEANIDSLFYAGNQDFINRYLGVATTTSQQKFYFNLIQQPVNMTTGYQRQHRKNFNYIPGEGADTQTCDQYNKLMTHVCNTQGIHEQFSRGCEQSAITGMVLLQPYLDYTGDDPAQGSLKLKLWEYNSFIVDPYMRDFASGSDCNYVWCQEYISKLEAEARFPDKKNTIVPMSSTPQRFGRFYFLPENHHINRNDLYVISYVWYKWSVKKKRLYSRSRNQFFDFSGGEENLEQILYHIPDLEEVSIDTPTWKLAVVLNDQLMFQGVNPLGGDLFPFVNCVWNYEPHLNHYDLRSRGLVRTMRSSQYLLNRRIILNHDISEATINAGWKRKIGAVANEDNLKKSGQGWDVIINEGYELMDCEKIIPSAVPESDMALADQLQQLIFATSGINLENWSAQDSPNASSLTVLMKQAANLMVLQKYFDQWDLALKHLGALMLQIVQNNWNAPKVQLIIGEEPSPFFYSRVFSKYQVVVEEGILTPTQQYQEYQQWLELNQQLGGIIPPQELAKRAPIQGKKELMEMLEQQAKQAQEVQSQTTAFEHAVQDAVLKEKYSKSAEQMARAHEAHARADSNIGLREERESEVIKNKAMATKERMAALKELMDVARKYSDMEIKLKEADLQQFEAEANRDADEDKMKAQREAEGNKFVAQIMSGMMGQQQTQEGQPQEQGQQSQMQGL